MIHPNTQISSNGLANVKGAQKKKPNQNIKRVHRKKKPELQRAERDGDTGTAASSRPAVALAFVAASSSRVVGLGFRAEIEAGDDAERRRKFERKLKTKLRKGKQNEGK